MLSLKYDLIRMLEALRQFKQIAKGVYPLLIDLAEGDGVNQLRHAIIHHDIIADEAYLLKTYHQMMHKFSVFSEIRDLERGNEIASFSKQLRELTRSGSSNGAFPIVVSTEREQTFPFRPVAEQLASLIDSIKANSRDYSDANIPVDNLEAQMKQKSFIMAIAEAGEIVKTMRALPNATELTLPNNVLNAFCQVRNQFDHYNVLKDLHQTHSGSSMHSSLSFIMSHFTPKNHAKHSHGSASRG